VRPKIKFADPAVPLERREATIIHTQQHSQKKSEASAEIAIIEVSSSGWVAVPWQEIR
jgi:hypothetical protein